MAILTTLLKQKAAGQFIGLLASKTQYGATVGGLTGLWALLPRLMEKDPEAIGLATLIVFSWLGALYGRWKAKAEPKIVLVERIPAKKKK